MAVAVFRFTLGDLQAVAMAVKGDKVSPRCPPLMEKSGLCGQGRPHARTLTRNPVAVGAASASHVNVYEAGYL